MDTNELVFIGCIADFFSILFSVPFELVMPASVEILLSICFREYLAPLSHGATNHGVLICTILAGAFVQVYGVFKFICYMNFISRSCLFCISRKESCSQPQVVYTWD